MPVPIGGFSVAEFRAEHGLSPAQYATMQSKGLGPKETLFPDSRVRRILPDDYAAWIERIKQPDVQIAEAERRRAIHQRMGKAALRSPNHPSNLLRGLRATPPPVPRKRGRPRKHMQAAE